MAGQKHAPLQIVGEILPINNLEELSLTLGELCTLTLTTVSCIKFLAKCGLIKNARKCVACNVTMSLQVRSGPRYIDGYIWSCRLCRRNRNIREGSFFQGSHLQLNQLLDIIYWWSLSVSESRTKIKCVISSWATAVDWINSIRNICAMCIIDHPILLGGPGKVVEMDESKFMHREEGHWANDWVLGMVERGTNNCAMVIVEEHGSAATRLPIIQEHVLPGTQIITDDWRAYNGLVNQKQDVDHKLNFANPIVHTNSAESSWRNSKTNFRQMHRPSDSLINSYFQEYIWRKNFGENPFGNILYWIRHYY
ncbi:hypothetical protein GQR58_008712 [Nymphon striatum]|nr:hypothetical protein GQR58_008712 [Nymphon striatum]